MYRIYKSNNNYKITNVFFNVQLRKHIFYLLIDLISNFYNKFNVI